jgi:hypothetical protein
MSQRFFDDEFACNLDSNYSILSTNPDIALNCKYRDELKQLEKQEGNYEDIKHLHFRAWIQAMNLIGGCIILGVLIYRQK